MPRPSALFLEEWAPGNYPAGAEAWAGQPRRTPARRPIEAGTGYVPLVPFHAGGVNDYTELQRLWTQWALQLAIGLHSGSGADGDVVIAGTTTLTRDMYYDTLTIDVGGVLNTAGYRVFARTRILNNGTIRVTASLVGANGGAGAGGTGGAVPSNGTLGMGFAGGAGGAPANPGVAGTNATSSVGGAGAVGGVGDTAGGNQAGGAAATANPVAEVIGGLRAIYALPFAITGRALDGTLLRGGAGGSGGGGGRSAGTPQGGGGGGAGSGVMVLVSPEIENNGVIQSNGGQGGNGGDNGSSSGGGGSGGGAGAIVIVTGHRFGSGTTTVDGGLGGSPGVLAAGATAGAQGAAGQLVIIDAAA